MQAASAKSAAAARIRRVMIMWRNSSGNLAQWSAERQPCAMRRCVPILALALLMLGFLMPVQAFAETVDQRIARLEPLQGMARAFGQQLLG